MYFAIFFIQNLREFCADSTILVSFDKLISQQKTVSPVIVTDQKRQSKF